MRNILKIKFIEKYLPTEYQLKPLLADASFRKYDRVITKDRTYILMDSPPEHYSTEPFEMVAEFLSNNNLMAPKIFSGDRDNGFLLLEDFGDRLMQHSLGGNREALYKKAVDILLELHKVTPPDWMAHYSKATLLKELEIFTDYYVPWNLRRKLSLEEKNEYLGLWAKALSELPYLGDVVVLRDYHVQNLMHLDCDNLGLLDFQDAVIGSPIYDLVSILEDAREDVDFEFAEEILDYYLANMTDMDLDSAYLAYDILGAQRNSRILGVFARKQIRDGNDSYLQYIPRVANYLERDLENPVLEKIREWHSKFF